jgi:poly(3-hydroxybutyrate) depolymerase
MVNILFAAALNAAVALGAATASAHTLINRTVSGRSTLVYVPDDYLTRTKPMQPVLALHPSTGSASGFQNITKFETRAGATDSIIIYPSGSVNPASGDMSWEAADPSGASRGDEEYLLAVIADVATLAPGKVKAKFAVVGFSAGSLMTYQMLCQQGNKISAAVPYAAYFGNSYITDTANCPWPTRNVPVMHMHGDADEAVNPITGTGDADPIYHFDVLSSWMAADGSRNDLPRPAINFTTINTTLGTTAQVVNSATAYVILPGIQHRWPGMPASDAVLDFFGRF